MFRDIILGYYQSPSLGEKFYSYELELKKELRWRMFSCFLLLFIIFTFFISTSFKLPVIRGNSSVVNSTSLNKKLLYNVRNTSKNTLHSGDIVSYILKAKNTTPDIQYTDFKIQISDILEYATLLDGGDYKIDGDFIYWNNQAINPSQSAEKAFAIRIKDSIPSFKQNNNSYDCKISTSFGNTLTSNVSCPLLSKFNKINESIPRISNQIILLILILLFSISIVLTIRVNLLYNEVRLIRRYIGEIR